MIPQKEKYVLRERRLDQIGGFVMKLIRDYGYLKTMIELKKKKIHG